MESQKRTSDLIHKQLKQVIQDGGGDRAAIVLLKRAIDGVKGLRESGGPSHPVLEPNEAANAPDVAPPTDSDVALPTDKFERFDQWRKKHGGAGRR